MASTLGVELKSCVRVSSCLPMPSEPIGAPYAPVHHRPGWSQSPIPSAALDRNQISQSPGWVGQPPGPLHHRRSSRRPVGVEDHVGNPHGGTRVMFRPPFEGPPTLSISCRRGRTSTSAGASHFFPLRGAVEALAVAIDVVGAHLEAGGRATISEGSTPANSLPLFSFWSPPLQNSPSALGNPADFGDALLQPGSGISNDRE